MINQNIIEELLPHNDDINNINYFYVITDIKQESECNQDTITFKVAKINKSLSELDPSFELEKKLILSSNIDIKEGDKYASKIIGYETQKKKEHDEWPENSSHSIEVLQTELKKEIEIDFNKTYTDCPSIIVNIDKQYESLYRGYSREYKKDENEKYTGVIITFNYLKTKVKYPYVTITIIGDLYTNEETEQELIEDEP